MQKLLFCWVGRTDLRARTESESLGLGPIAQAVTERAYDGVILINNYPADETNVYVEWLTTLTSAPITTHHCTLSSPTHFGEIYEQVISVVGSTIDDADSAKLTFHLSPGTPAMAAVWIILAKTRFPAELIESSQQHGVQTASVPFDIAADFIPNLFKGPDKRLERLSAGLPPDAPEFDDIVHRSEVMRRVILKARRAAPRSVPVLIEGASGTGKELLARAIHKASPRKDQPFIAVNCGAIPSELVESELFGHMKGAFTGADSTKAGYFEAADNGSLFLDEVGELPLLTQVKLLRTLQEDEVLRLGTSIPKKVNVRVIAATNRSLTEEVAAGRFRSDLFYRLAVAMLHLPPIKERPGDLSLLIDALLDQVNAESAEEPGYTHKKLSASATNLLMQHPWPGNVRELLNTLRRASIWAEGPVIRSDDIRESLICATPDPQAKILNRTLSEEFNLPELINTVARHYLERALDESRGNKAKATKLLGLSNYQTLTNWLKKYGVTE